MSVEEFAFDKLRVLVNNNTGADAILYYADAWHPEWHAYVNGKPSSVFKTNLAYKSVMIPPGKVEVLFKFGDTISKLLLKGVIAVGICVFCAIIYLLCTEFRNKDKRRQ